MHKIVTYTFTLLFGVLIAFVIASIVGAILPIAAIPVFLGLSILVVLDRLALRMCKRRCSSTYLWDIYHRGL